MRNAKTTIKTAAKQLAKRGMVLGLSHHDLTTKTTFYTVTTTATGEMNTVSSRRVIELLS